MQNKFTLGGILTALLLVVSITQTNAHFATRLMVQLQNTIQKEITAISNSLHIQQDNHTNFFNSSSTALMMPCSGAADEIGGTVFGDYNKDGLNNQIGFIPGVTVYIFGLDGDGNSIFITSTTTDENGDYSFTGLTNGAAYRLEFVPPAGVTPGFGGLDNGTDVQFVTAPTCEANAGFSFPEDYCADADEVPNMIIGCFVNSDPLAGEEDIANEEALVLFPYDAADNSPNPITLAVASEVGAIHGIAYKKSENLIYTSAFIKRHVGLGPMGIDGIYTVDVTDINNPVVAQFLNLGDVGINVGNIPSNTDRGLIPGPEDPDPSNDPLAYDGVGKLGVGAMALSEDESTLWITNLSQRVIHSIELDADNNPATPPLAADVTSFSFPDPGCTNGTFRPFALKYYRGTIYVGGICDAETGTADDLEAIVYRLDGASFTEIFRFDLNYPRGYANKDGDCEMNTGWYPWRDDIPPSCTNAGTFITWPTPIFCDLEFDTDGSLIMGFMDRMGHQIGYRNYPLTGTTPLLQTVSGGDLLRAFNNNGTYVLESNATAGPNTTGGVDNMQGPGGGEYYNRDVFEGAIDNLTGDAQPHRETAQGGLAFYTGSGEIATTSLDPYSTNFNVGGINWMDNQTGAVRNPGYRVYTTTSSNISTFQKANGLGDLMLQCAEAPLEIGGFVWDDANENGVQDPGEMGIVGITLIIYDSGGNPLAMTTTDANGNYYFNKDTPDLGALQKNTTYFVGVGSDGQFDPGTGLLQGAFSMTIANSGMGPNTDFNDSDGTIADGSVASGALAGFPYYEVTTGGNGFVDHSNDIGFNRLTGITGFVWQDDDMDGIQDAGENGIEGVTVSLFQNDGTFVTSVTTNSGGTYTITDVVAGDYYIVFDESTNTGGVTTYQGSPQNAGDGTNDSDPDPNTGQTNDFSFNPADGILSDIDAGFFLPTGDIGGFVWEDTDGDGIQDGGEPGIEGVTVILYDSNDNPIDTVMTDANGDYTFMDVPPGDYYIIFDESTNTGGVPNYEGSPQNTGDGTNDSDPNPTTGQTDTFTFDPTNGDENEIDAGFMIPDGSIGGYVWEDTDIDGIQDNDENGIEGVTVSLFEADGTFVTSTTTDANGLYSFNNVPLGDYYIVFDESTNTAGVPNYQGTLPNVGDGTNDSDPDPITGQTVTFSFDPANGNNNEIDAGFYEPAARIGGYVWEDSDMDGIQDNDENGIEGVTVSLYRNDGTLVGTTTTDSGGFYNFPDQVAGTYYVIFDESTNTAGIPNYQGTLQGAGNSFNDSDADPATGQTPPFNFDPASGNLTDIDAGYFVSIGTLVGFAWHDVDEDGIKDNGEAGIEGVTVELFTSGGTSLGTTTTNASGMYMFTGVTGGDYYVVFDVSTNTAGINDYAGTLQNIGDDNFDSDANPNTGQTDTFTFNPDGNNDDVNAGYTLPVVNGSIGDFAFLDFNRDGIQDAGEFGLVDVPVTLTGNVVTGAPVNRSTTTDENGLYIFENVAPGTYTITFGFPPNFTELQRSPQDAGNDDTRDSDANTGNGQTAAFAFGAGETIDHIDAGYFDDKPPSFPDPIGDVVLDCNDPEVDNPTTPNVFDDFDQNVEITLMEVVNNNGGLCDGSFLIVRTWTATDDFGNTATYTQNITINDDEPPVLVGVPADVTVDCDELPDPANVTATDNCDDDVPVAFMETTEGEGCTRTVNRTWSASDDCGNTTAATQVITLIDNSPPVVTFTHPELAGVMDGDTVYVECTSELPFGEDDAIAVDACFDTLEVVFYDFIASGGICVEDGYIWEMVCVWEATDPCGNTGQLAITVYFVDTTPPVLMGVPDDITVDCEEVPENTAVVTATDNCDEEVFVTYLEIISGDICFDYTVTRRWSAIDDCGNIVVEEQIITVLVDDLKIIGVPDDLFLDCDDEIPPPADVILLGDCYNPELLFEETILGDTCMDYKIVRQWTGRNDCGLVVTEVQSIFINVPDLEFLEFPEAISVECDEIPEPETPPLSHDCYNLTIEFEETIIGDTCHDYKILRKWTAMNDCGQMAMTSQTITVEVPELMIEVPDDITINCHDDKPPVFMPVVDTFCFDVQVDFVEIIEPGECEDEYQCIRTWKATSSCGDEVTETQIISVIDTIKPLIIIDNPALDGVENGDTIFVNCGEIPLINPDDATATDNCDPNPNIIFSEDITNSDDCEFNDYMIKMTCGWTAIDRCGNICKFEFCIIVQDEIPPVITGVPGNTSINASDGLPPMPTDVHATDNCTENPLMTFSETVETEEGQCGYTVLRTWSAFDDCGNTTLETQTIIVNDICDCPDIDIENYQLKDATCNNADGSIKATPGNDPAIFEYALVPDVGTSNDIGNERYDLAPGSYLLLIYLPNVDDCIEKIYFNIGQGNCRDTMAVTLPDELSQICLDDAILDYEGNITNTSFCDEGNASTVLGTEINGECVSVLPAQGYEGTETICVIHCFNGSTSECDTTYIEITVEPIVIPCELEVTSNVTQPDCGQTNGSVQLNVTGAIGNLTYQWSPNVSSSSTANNLGNGTYDVIITDQETDCTTSTSVTITEPTLASISASDVTITDVACPDDNDGGAIVSNTGTAYIVTSQNGTPYGPTPVFDLPAGNYEVSTTNADGCTASVTVTINQPDPWQLTSSSSPETCAGNDGSISISVNGGVQPYTYQWTPDVSSSGTANGLNASTVYSVLITDGAGCSLTLTDLTVALDCDNTCTVAGGTISTNDATTFCVEDGNEDFVNINVSGNSGSYIFVVTEADGNIILLSEDPVFNFEGESEGNLSIIGIAHDGSLSGLEDGDNINDLTGCIDLSNAITITALGGGDCQEPCNVEGGTIFTSDPTTFCADDGQSDIVNIASSGSAGSIMYLVTDANGLILGMTTDPFFNLEGAGGGICLLYALAFDGEISNANVGQNISNIQGCTDFSNSIEVTRLIGNDCDNEPECIVNGGSISTDDATTICADDGLSDIINLTPTGHSGEYMYIVTSADSTIIGTTTQPFFNLEGAGAGNCLLWGMAFDGAVVNADTDRHITEIQGCTDLSNPIVVTRLTGTDCDNEPACNVEAGSITTQDPTTICVDDNDPDIINVTVSGHSGDYMYLITTADSVIITPSNSSVFNFEGAGAGLCLIWGVANDGGVSGATEGQHLSNLDGCFDLSEPITIKRNEGEDCDGNNPGSVSEICDNGIDDDNDGLVDCEDPDCCDFEGCGQLWEQSSMTAGVQDCLGATSVCLDIPLSTAQDYSISVDGSPYTNGISGCDFDTTLSYSYVAIPEQGTAGPYLVNSWTVNDVTFFGSFDDLNGLIDSMNTWDNTGNWMIDTDAFSITGGNPSSVYSNLSITQQADNATASLELNTNFIAKGTALSLELGSYQLVFTHNSTGCTDTLQLEVACQPDITSETIVVSLPLNETNTLCLDTLQLPGIVNDMDWTCLDVDNCSNVFFDVADYCITYTGEAVGIDTVQTVICDNLNYCDTTTVVIIVESLMPVARIDADTTAQGNAVVIDVLANDDLYGELVSMSLINQAVYGTLEENIDHSFIYTPEDTYCGTDAFAYEICNGMGCDTASVNVMVLCGEPAPYSGFSPNGDGVNETFYIAGLNQFPVNELQVFNVWGMEIFYAKDYKNDWNGKWKDKDLPDGTYYYIFTYDGGKRMTGYVVLRR